MHSDYVFTSESVSDGHPDKVADQISDAILDWFIAADKYAKVAIETLVTTNRIILAGEVKSELGFLLEEINSVARNVVRDIGYEQKGFDHRSLHIDNYIHTQSPDITMGVEANKKRSAGAGDQGIMFGYACNETDSFMPFCIHYAHAILRAIKASRKKRLLWLLPDAKSQITVRYVGGQPKEIDSVVVSHQHEEWVKQDDLKYEILQILQEVLPSDFYDHNNCTHHINPTGRFVIGGPDGDTGLTGRKIIVDTYGGAAPHGGGAFSGKDPTKVDRSAAYMARYLAKNILAAGLASKCLIQLSYAIGVPYPLSIYVNCFGTANVAEAKITDCIKQLVDLSPRGISEILQLNLPIYRMTSTFGHFGRDSYENYFSWEKLDLVEKIKNFFNLS